MTLTCSVLVLEGVVSKSAGASGKPSCRASIPTTSSSSVPSESPCSSTSCVETASSQLLSRRDLSATLLKEKVF